MILGFFRLMLFGAIAMTVVYVLVSVYSRSVRRESLEKKFDAGEAEGDAAGDRDAYIAQGMQAYERGLRRKLIWLVYIIPAVVFTTVFWTLNFS
ncbi:MAG: hypothetical protein V4712_03955 [Pseudomonadota bacterium]